jgi:hypothetical protein
MLEAVSKLGRLLHWLKVKNPKPRRNRTLLAAYAFN